MEIGDKNFEGTQGSQSPTTLACAVPEVTNENVLQRLLEGHFVFDVLVSNREEWAMVEADSHEE